VSHSLGKHPLWTRPKGFYDAKKCQEIYLSLMSELVPGIMEPSLESERPKDPMNLKLARKYYNARVTELVGFLEQNNKEFNKITAEIQEIEQGEWDSRIAEEQGALVDGKEQEEGQQLEQGREDGGVSEVDEEMVDNAVDDMDIETSIFSSPNIHVSEPSPNSPGTRHGATKVTREGAATNISLLDDGAQSYTSEGIIDLEMESGTVGVPTIQLLEKQIVEDAFTTPSTPTTHQITHLNNPPSPGSNIQVPSVRESPRLPGGVREHPQEIPPAGVPEESTSIPRNTDGQRKAKRKAQTTTELRESKRTRQLPSFAVDASLTSMTPGSSLPGGTTIRRMPNHTSLGEAQKKRFEKSIGILHQQISDQKNAEIFAEPVNKTQASDYNQMVLFPIDLKTIRQHLKRMEITDIHEYKRAVFLMLCNAIMYNAPDSQFFAKTKETLKTTEELFEGHQASKAYSGNA